VSAALRRCTRGGRRLIDKQNSENSSLLSGEAVIVDQVAFPLFY
jgi:hypothetical protein